MAHSSKYYRNTLVGNHNGIFLYRNTLVGNHNVTFLYYRNTLVGNHNVTFLYYRNTLVCNHNVTFLYYRNTLVGNHNVTFIYYRNTLVGNHNGTFLYYRNTLVGNHNVTFLYYRNTLVGNGSFHVRSTSVLQWPPPICFTFGTFVDIYYTNKNANFQLCKSSCFRDMTLTNMGKRSFFAPMQHIKTIITLKHAALKHVVHIVTHHDTNKKVLAFCNLWPAIEKNALQKRSRQNTVVRVLDSGLRTLGSWFDPHTGYGSLLKLRQFHLPLVCISILSCKWVPTLLGRYWDGLASCPGESVQLHSNCLC